MSNKGKASMASTQSKRGYLTWTKQMDEILIEVLNNQMKEGNKADWERKPQAYKAVADELMSRMGISTSTDNVRNRIKSWKKHYAVISDIRAFSKFKWDEEKKMIAIAIEDLEQWARYVEDHPIAAPYRNKSIDYWDDICTLCGPDREEGNDAETHEAEAVVAIDGELQSEGGISSRRDSSSSKSKKQKRDRLADAVNSFAECFRDYVQSKPKEVPKPTPSEVYEVVKKVKGIGQHRQHIMKAAKRFMDGPVHDFEMLKALPDEEKLDWVSVCLYG